MHYRQPACPSIVCALLTGGQDATRMRRRVLVIAVVMLAVGLASCGGSSPAPSGATATTDTLGAHTPPARPRIRTNFAAVGVSLATLRMRENRACTKLVDRLRTLPELMATSGFKAVLDHEISYLAKFNRTIYKLSAPLSSAAAYRRFVYANEGALDLFRRLEPYFLGARKGSMRAERLMERGSVADRDAARYGRRLGLSACATGQMHRG